MNELRGTVPPYYRDVYDVLCPSNNESVSQNTITQLLNKSGLEKSVLSQIWGLIDVRSGTVNRSNLYKTLALIAFAQQGKSISDKLLENFAGEELPRPSLGDAESLKQLGKDSYEDPSVLNVSYDELCTYDTIEVDLMPERKGIFLKHVEYEVNSKRNKSTVKRRYSDFVALREVLQQVFPYRMIPKLPPKKMLNSDEAFIESRRKALRRFLNIISRHPSMYDSQVLEFFYTNNGEVVNKIKDKFKNFPDEFITNPHADNAKDFVGPETHHEFATYKDQVRDMFNHVTQFRDIATRLADRSKGNSLDMLGFGEQLKAIGNDNRPTSQWASGKSSPMESLKKTFRSLAVDFSAISEKYSLQNKREEEGVVDQLNTLFDILVAFQDLCDRHERGVLKEHHYALKKYGALKTKRMAASIANIEQPGMDKMDTRIQAQANLIETREKRNSFSLHCIHLDAQLLQHITTETLSRVLTTLQSTQLRGHQQLATLWKDVLAPLSIATNITTNGN